MPHGGVGYVSSFTSLVDPFVLHEAMPPSIAEVDEYISLLPMVWLFAAVKTKYGSPALEVFRS